MDFQKPGQNQKAVQIERDSLSHTKLNIENLRTLFLSLKLFEKVGTKSWPLIYLFIFSVIPALLWHSSAFH